MQMNFETGMGIMFDDGDGYGYGVVMGASNGLIDVVPVFQLGVDDRCYDEGGASYETDRDNVRLADCLPPFTLLCAFAGRSGCYALADPSRKRTLSADDAARLGVTVVDGGTKVSERDMDAIRDHPWRDEKQADRKSWQRFAAEPEPVPEPAKPKSMSSLDRLRAAAALADGIGERGAGPDGPEF